METNYLASEVALVASLTSAIQLLQALSLFLFYSLNRYSPAVELYCLRRNYGKFGSRVVTGFLVTARMRHEVKHRAKNLKSWLWRICTPGEFRVTRQMALNPRNTVRDIRRTALVFYLMS